MQRTYRTPKGTELPLLNLRGREYLEVKYRLVWFREDHPDWAIETELLSVTELSAYARAIIKDDKGRIIATSHKFETKKGFPDFIEKAETGAIGRALALIGYGTQFCADELDEGERVVDAPVDFNLGRAEKQAPALSERAFDVGGPGSDAEELGRRQPKRETAKADESSKAPSIPQDPGEYQITFGKKYKGLKLRDIPRNELEGYIEWLEENASKKGLPLSEEARFLKVAVGRFLQGGQQQGSQGQASAAKKSSGRPADASAKH